MPITFSLPIKAGLLVIFMTSLGCSTSGTKLSSRYPGTLPEDPIAASPKALKACTRWKTPLYAHISHVSVTPDGHRILVSTSGEKRTEARLRLYNDSGKLLWAYDLPQPVRLQSLSSDGKIAAINSYDNLVRVFNGAGKKIWQKEHLGKPLILSTAQRVLVLNDDDAEPKTAFVIYDYAGNKTAEIPTPQTDSAAETLDMTVSSDESAVAVVMSDNSVFVYNLEGKEIWKNKFSGEVINAVVSGAQSQGIYSLLAKKGDPSQQSLEWKAFHDNNSSRPTQWTTNLEHHYDTVRLVNETLFVYGNSPRGQAIAAFEASSGKLIWKRSYSIPATYTSLVFGANAPEASITAAIETGKSTAGILDIMSIDTKGQTQWTAPIDASDGIYSFSVADKKPSLVVGTGEPGNGTLQYFNLQTQSCP